MHLVALGSAVVVVVVVVVEVVGIVERPAFVRLGIANAEAVTQLE